jgi:hypothetical protein
MTMKTLRILAAAVIAATSLGAQAVGNLADVSIYDRATGRTLPVQWHDGKYYVVGKPGNEYEIHVRSARGEDLLAVMSVDGVNVLTGQTASTGQGGYVLSAWNRMSIKGWRKSMDEIAAFYFTSLGDSYANRTGRPDNVGVIGVALYQRKRVEPPPPIAYESRPYERNESGGKLLEKRSADAAGAAAREMAPSAPLGTGHGRREESRTTATTFERASDTPAETIAIYYDSYRNLVAKGVFQAQAPREPNPFPTSFAPDPWR